MKLFKYLSKQAEGRMQVACAVTEHDELDGVVKEIQWAVADARQRYGVARLVHCAECEEEGEMVMVAKIDAMPEVLQPRTLPSLEEVLRMAGWDAHRPRLEEEEGNVRLFLLNRRLEWLESEMLWVPDELDLRDLVDRVRYALDRFGANGVTSWRGRARLAERMEEVMVVSVA